MSVKSKLCLIFAVLCDLMVVHGEPLVWAVRLKNSDHHSVASDVGLRSAGPATDLLQDIYEFHLSDEDHLKASRDLGSRGNVLGHYHAHLMSHPEIEWVEHQHSLVREKRVNFNDPSFPHQWHLVNNQEIGHDVNVTDVWRNNITGIGVTVAVIDDGLQHQNNEIMDNYNPEGSYDFNDYDSDPTPDTSTTSFNSHGTRCAGLVASVANNSICGVGVAYHSTVSGIRLLDGTITDLLEAKALSYRTHINHIYSCSWGPTDDGMTVESPGTLAQLAFQLGTQRGRYGYGSLYIFASGNGGNKQDNCNFDGYANSIYTITIGAVDELDKKPYYAEECSAKLAVTYSNGVKRGDRNIVTADITRESGCTSGFSGTSAAAPMAAGLIALALQVRNCLTWRDVQSIVVYTAVMIDISEGEWSMNGARFNHSHQHGFGVLDAYRLSRMAMVWPLLSQQVVWSSGPNHVSQPIPYSSSSKLTSEISVSSDLTTSLNTLEHVAVTVSIDHSYRGAIIVDLISPSGTVSHLATSRKKDSSAKGLKDWTFTTVRCWGEEPVGVWSLEVQDDITMGLAPEESDESRGSLLEWSLVLYGSNLTIQDISYRRKLMNDAINSQDVTSSLSCPPHPTNLEDITFPDSPLGNKFLKILSALALVIVSILFLHLLLTYIYRKVKENRSYRAALPSIHFNRHSTSTAGDEEEVLLLETTSVDKDNETKDPWNDTDHDTTNQTEPNNTSV